LDSSTSMLYRSHTNNKYQHHIHSADQLNPKKNGLYASSRLYGIRGGFIADTISSSFDFNVVSKLSAYILSSPTNLFNSLLASLACLTFLLRFIDSRASASSSQSSDDQVVKPAGVKSLQFRFLSVFWLMRMAGMIDYEC